MAKPTDTNEDKDPPRRNWVGAVSMDASMAAKPAFTRAGFQDPTLVLHWAEIAGPQVAALATPIKLTDGPSGGVLTLKSEPGAAVFLQHQTRDLCDRINGYLGRPAVARLRFVQGPLVQKAPPRPPRSKPGPVLPTDAALKYEGPDKVRDALINLARARRAPLSSD
jgi:hypothetical protein